MREGGRGVGAEGGKEIGTKGGNKDRTESKDGPMGKEGGTKV